MTKWELHEPAGWVAAVAAFKQRVSDRGRIVTLSGNCPRCAHLMSVDLAIEDRTGRRVTKGAGKTLGDRYFYKLAYCNCPLSHADRPADQAGCGAYGLLKVGDER